MELGRGEPSVGMEYGETFEECVIRETYEETGILVTNPYFVGVTNDVFDDEHKHYVSVFLQAHVADGIMPQIKEPDKIRSWQWFDMDSLPNPLFLSLQKFVDNQVYKTPR